jgi:putative heme-binding domain-containing protein
MEHLMIRRLAFAIFLLILVQPAYGQQDDPNIASTPPLAPEEQLKKFHLPPGFVIELVAAEPKINKPINIAFDAMGRLWVTESVEYPFPAPKNRPAKDKVKVLSDFADNGLSGTITTFASGLNIPIGVLPALDGHDAIVYSIPSIFRISAQGTRVALYSQYGYRDTHGMTGEFMRGFDGWIYCCHGYSNTSTVKSKGGTAITMQSGNTYRIKPDASRIEYFTHGQVNPFGLAVDPLGNLYSCDCHSRPIYQLLHGAYYPSFGKPDDGLGYGPELLTHDHGSTAIAGITYYAADQFPLEYRDNIFIGNVVTNRINRDRLEVHGSGYKGIEMPDFVKCDDPWFRPVDIKLGPDGAMYVADFYNRIIGHYEVPLTHPGRDREKGRIWRIYYRGLDGQGRLKSHRDLTRASDDELVAELDNPNLMVRMLAMEQLIALGPAVLEKTKKVVDQGSSFQKAHGLWVLERLKGLDETTLQKAARDPDRLVRVHAMKILDERSAWQPDDRPLVLAGLQDSDSYVERNAAAALGSHPEAANIEWLLKLRRKVSAEDTHLIHVTNMALRDQLVRDKGVQLAAKTWTDNDSRTLAHVCLGVHDEESAAFLQRHLENVPETADGIEPFTRYIARYGKDGSGTWVLKWIAKNYPLDITLQGRILKGVHEATQERGAKPGAMELAMAEKLSVQLLSVQRLATRNVALGIELAGMFKLTAAQDSLLAVVRNPKEDKNARKNAVVALLAIDAKRNVAALTQLITTQDEAIELREQIAQSLAATNLPEATAALLKALETAPARLQTGIAVGLAGSPKGGDKLLQAVAAGKASGRLLLETPVYVRLQQAKVPNLKERLAQLTKGLPTPDQRIHELMSQRRAGYAKASGDAAAGLKIFEKHCANCHQIANKGAKIGPQLDGVGIRGLERLLEDILDPNRNVDQAFRTTTLVLNNGQLVNGLLLRQDGTVLVLADIAGKEVRVPAAEVQERILSPLSPMPANFAEQIPEGDFYHLLAYLLAQRTKD